MTDCEKTAGNESSHKPTENHEKLSLESRDNKKKQLFQDVQDNFVTSPAVLLDKRPLSPGPPSPGPPPTKKGKICKDPNRSTQSFRSNDPSDVEETAGSTEMGACPASSECVTSTAPSPPNFLRVPPTLPASSTTSSTAPSRETVTVKSEPQDDIKDYVETTMNELLGWYGLPKMDKSDTPSVSLETYPPALPDHTSPLPDHPLRPNNNNTPHAACRSQADLPGTDASSRSSLTTDGKKRSAVEKRQPGMSAAGGKMPNDTNNNSSSCGADDEEDEDEMDDYDNDDGLGDDLCDDMDDLRDSASVGSDVSGLVSPALTGGGVSEHERGAPIVCSWCQKNGNKLYTLGTSTGNKAFCSEVCFTQCRRASFKKNKVCDWCKHVRHTVNFVDFQDGDVQLQFCSEKCLNQYKMNVFCTEARQHLQAIQSMAASEDEKGGDGRSEPRQGEILITPELWMSGDANGEPSIKEEVVDAERNEKVSERSQAGVKMDRGYDDEDEGEPGELREREKFGRHLVMDGRTDVTDDSSCSNEGKVASSPVTASSPVAIYREKNESRTSLLNHPSSKSDIQNHSEHRQRREKDRLRKTPDSKSRSLSSEHVRDYNKVINSFNKRDRAEKNQTSQRFLGLSPAIAATSAADSPSSQTFLPNWATSHLMAMIPPNVSPHLGVSNLGPLNCGGGGHLLYSSLFGNAHVIPGGGSGGTNKEAQAKARHESRRELLRDRDRCAEHSGGERKRDGSDRPGAQKSSSTSHSSVDPACLTGAPGFGLFNSQGGLNLNLMKDFSKHLTQFQMGNLNAEMNLPHYLTNPALAGMFQLPFAYNPGQGHSVPFVHPPAAQIPTSSTQSSPSSSRQQNTTHPPPFPTPQGVPPITILVPYPVAVPIPLPIPVPVPIPISPEVLFAYFREKEESGKSTTVPKETPHVSVDLKPEPRSRSTSESRPRAASACHLINPSPGLSPRPSSKCSSVGGHPLGSASSLLDSPESGLLASNGRESADSIMTLRREIGRSQLKAASTSPCTSSSYKHIMTPIMPYSIDLSSKTSRVCLPHHNEDEAIDLSKMSTRSDSPRRSVDISEKENKSLGKRASLSDSDIDGMASVHNLKVPRIHIISEPPEPPLSQPPAAIPLPPPPEQSSYSSRRSRILDAPSVPKKSRSPSPERRYIRTVPRDMVEAARRRGLRARVRTK